MRKPPVRLYHQSQRLDAQFFYWLVIGPKTKPTMAMGWSVKVGRWIAYHEGGIEIDVFRHKNFTENELGPWKQIYP